MKQIHFIAEVLKLKYDKNIISALLSESIFQEEQLSFAYEMSEKDADPSLYKLDFMDPINNVKVLQWILQQTQFKNFSLNRHDNMTTASVTTYSNATVTAYVYEEQKDEALLYCLLALTMVGKDVKEALIK